MTADDTTQGHCPESANSQSLEGLRSTRSNHRLNQIDRVRANGVGDHISLPQLVVCGDQSAGKSSVLEGITGIPFPRQDGVCTKFATEIILRHNLEVSRITATVIPHVSRSEADKERFRVYRRDLQGFLELPDIISEAASLMRIRGYDGVVDRPAFAADVLRIEVVGDYISLSLTYQA
jgi:Dynamin family